MNKILKYLASVSLLFIGLGTFAQEKSRAYYDTHESEILPDAQAAFRNGEYDLSAELCRLHLILMGDQQANTLRANALTCSKLLKEMEALAKIDQKWAAWEKAKTILTLNPEDKKALELLIVPIRNDFGRHEWVDLGLPSGLKWATCNIGAYFPTDNGGYFAWGETSTKSYYGWGNLKYCIDTHLGHFFSKYIPSNQSNFWFGSGSPDNKTNLDLSDDAAHQNWGGKWRTPTREEWKELESECNWVWTTESGKIGYKVTGKNGNSIFLPAAGEWSGDINSRGSEGCYWSSTLASFNPECAYHMSFQSAGHSVDGALYRELGYTIRPVTE